MKRLLPALGLAFLSVSAQAAATAGTAATAAEAARRSISGSAWLEHVTALSSDAFEGRAPATPGEALTVDYLQQQFRKLGLAPGNPDGSYLQTVSMTGISSYPTLSYTVNGHPTQLRFGDDYVTWAARTDKEIDVQDSELVFVGYGIQAPEFDWDDYKGIDLKGKTVVMLINDPPVADSKRPRQLDQQVFAGAATSYYGRWAYKFEIAARLGATGALIVHDAKGANASYELIRNSWSRENFFIDSSRGHADFPLVPGWLQHERAQAMFKAGGHDLAALTKQAARRDFHPVPLGIKLNVSELNAARVVHSQNVVARIPGSDPALQHEVVLYSAHWDHFGLDDTLPGPRTQQVFHGALDNAAGVAALLEIARAYRALPVAPRRTIVFLATTAEERGQLGARYYARHPLYQLGDTVANINLHGANVWGPTRSVVLRGMGKSSADDVVVSAARRQGRTVKPESPLQAGGWFRGDQLEFARAGVPFVTLGSSVDYVGKPAGYGADKLLRYQAQLYHTVNDVVDPQWDLRGTVQDMGLLFDVGYRLAQDPQRPQWRDKVEFKR